MSEPLTTWRGCALYAKMLLERAHLDPSLHPHLHAFQNAVTLMLQQDAAAPPPMPPAIPPTTPGQPAHVTAQPAGVPQPVAPTVAQPAVPHPAPTVAQTAVPQTVAQTMAQAPGAPGPPPQQITEASPWAVDRTSPQAPAPVPASPWTAEPTRAAAPAATMLETPTTSAPTQGDVPPQPMRVFAYGRNDKGTLGQGHYRPPGWEPSREVTAPNEVIVYARGGRANSVFLTQSGKLLLSGSNASYLFMDRESRGRESPTQPTLLEGRFASRVFFGADATHIFALLDGHLHAWGRLANALGIDTRSPTLEPKPVTKLGPASNPQGVGGEQIRDMLLSTGHTIALATDGTIWMAGGNARGQLGMGAKNNPYEVFVFTAPDDVAGIRFAKIACSTLHSAAVSEDGRLFTTGRNESGELGHDKTEDHFRFTPVASGSVAGRRVVEVSCADQTTYCLTDDGKLHGAGSNARGELGLGELPMSTSFVELALPGERTVRQVAAGKNHVLTWCHDGTLWSWGDNNYAQVTPGARSRFVTTPTEVVGFADKQVMGISTGETHGMVLVAP